ncbi:hypothetical protein [uncultured Pseudokineococcus sp.]|uniref:hypothetical protein n=1 Tax=uncultured Pseudokineococcus sp. TaxID=1642928 RepID=UPI0026125E13|nr:hypothetical protein [uncultured Pseudokineococcus sp.]
MALLLLTACTGDPAPRAGAPSQTALDPTGTAAAPGTTAGAPRGGGDGQDAWAALAEEAGASAVGRPGPPLAGLGAKWAWNRVQQYQSWAEETAGGPSFVEVVWCDVEPVEGRRSFTRLERVLGRARAADVDVMVKIRVGRCWATAGSVEHRRGAGKTESAPPQDVEAYTDFVTDLVGRGAVLGVRTWAVENEVDAPTFWAGTAAEYDELARTAAAAVRAADPEARVLDSGISSVGHGRGVADRLLRSGAKEEAVAAWNAYYERRIGTRGEVLPRVDDVAALEEVLGDELSQRALAQLDVAADLAADGVVDARQVHFYEPSSQVAPLFDYLRATTPAEVPLEVWELGDFSRGGEAGDVSDAERDGELLRSTASVLAEGSSLVVWLPLAVDPGGRNADEPRWGLLDPDGEPRASAEGYATLARAARAGARAVPFVAGDVRGVGLETGGRTTAVLWSQGAPAELDLADVDVPGGEVGDEPVVVETDGAIADLARALR